MAAVAKDVGSSKRRPIATATKMAERGLGAIHDSLPKPGVQRTGSVVLLLWYPLRIVVVGMLVLRIRILCHALHRRHVLAHCRGGHQGSGWSHVEATVAERQMYIQLFYRVHFPASNILGGNYSRLILEGYAVVVPLRYKVGIALACRVEEVELLAPIAVALRFGAVVARWFRLIALEMALSTG